ncbi:AGAP009478-PA-like protein [Anopheles sinensis]|uniref:AGAP009478-PA-like protein n=1 Tax=Anopheles sinensis TaxID=74873 RepID=A0A084VPM6_ANOSI|nr:AGAP009478-PA-like protein [Anopheles sinensis]
MEDDADTSSASDVQENDDAGSDSSYDYKDVRKQLKVLKKKRSETWKMNGLDTILNDIQLNLSAEIVHDWMNKNKQGSNTQVVVGRESHITTQDGDSTMNLSCASNLTIVNGVDQKGISSENRSNYEMSSGNQKIVVHQVAKTILTTVTEITTEGHGSANHALSLGSFPGFNVQSSPLFPSFQGFKIPNPVYQQRFVSFNLPAIKDSACHKKNENMNAKHDKENVSKEHNFIHRKSSRLLPKETQKVAPKANVKESAHRKNPKKQHQRKKSCSDDEKDPHASRSCRTSKRKPPVRRGTRRIIEDTDSSSDDEATFQTKQKSLVDKSVRKANGLTEAKDTGEVDATFSSQQQAKALDIPCSFTTNNNTSANAAKLDAEFTTIISSSSGESDDPAHKQKNVLADCKAAKPDDKLAILTNSNSTKYFKPVTNIIKPSTRQQTKSIAPSNASDGKTSEQKANKLPVEASVRDSKPTSEPVQPEKYILPEYLQKQLSKHDRCGYKIEGIVIYTPKNCQASAVDTSLAQREKIEVTKRDLDLSAVSETRWKNFDGFRKFIHPDSTLVYYVTDSEASVSEDDGDDDDDDDDPITSFHPLVVYEYKHRA